MNKEGCLNFSGHDRHILVEKMGSQGKKEAGSTYIFVFSAITILSLILHIPTMVAHNE
jgi:hypothetical protein